MPSRIAYRPVAAFCADGPAYRATVGRCSRGARRMTISTLPVQNRCRYDIKLCRLPDGWRLATSIVTAPGYLRNMSRRADIRDAATVPYSSCSPYVINSADVATPAVPMPRYRPIRKAGNIIAATPFLDNDNGAPIRRFRASDVERLHKRRSLSLNAWYLLARQYVSNETVLAGAQPRHIECSTNIAVMRYLPSYQQQYFEPI